MPPPTTLLILTNKALNRPCGRECAEWAMAMLMEGHDGKNLATLASMRRFDNPFEMATLRDRALREVGAEELEGADVVLLYAKERLGAALDDTTEFLIAMREMHQLYYDADLHPDLADFQVYYMAYGDLQTGSDPTWNALGLTRENVVDKMRARARQFVNDDPPSSTEKER